jgi:hypothetical protein
MANVTPDNLRGILVPKASISKDNVWDAESSFTQANKRAGIPEPQQAQTNLVLSCIGEQSEKITVETKRAGLPGNAGFVWSGADNVQLGKNHSNIITDSKFFLFSSIPGYQDFDCIADYRDGSVYIVSELFTTAYTISLHKQEKNGAVTLKKTFKTSSISSATNAKPMVTILPDGSILVAYFNYTTEDYINVIVWRSLDRGDTWDQISTKALLGPYQVFVGTNGWELGKCNLFPLNDKVVMIMELVSQGPGGGNDSITFVSRDQGATFKSVERGFTQDFHEISAIPLDDGSFSLTYITDTQDLYNMIVPDVSIFFGDSDFYNNTQVEVSSGALTFCNSLANPSGAAILANGSMTSWFQDGNIYIAAKLTNDDIVGFLSQDLGETWEYIAGGFTPDSVTGTIYPSKSTIGLDRMKSCVWEGFALVLGQTANSILGMYLGGYSDVCFPAVVDQPDIFQYLNYSAAWMAHYLPELSTNWTTGGAGTKTITADGLRLQTSTQIRSFSSNAVSLDEKQILRFKLKVVTGTSTVDDYIAVVKNSDNGVNAYTVKLRFSTTGFKVLDHSSQLSSQSIDMTDYVEFMVSTDGPDAVICWRAWDEKQAKKWEAVEVTLGTQGTGIGDSLKWGHVALFTGSLESYWTEFHIGTAGNSLGEELRASTYPPFGRYQYIDQGLNLTSREAPAREGDQYTINPRYDFPIDNIFHQVAQSPRIVWRSENDTASQTIGIFMDANVGANEANLSLNDVGGLHLSNINFEEFVIQFWDTGTMAWTDHMTVNVSDGLTGTFQRVGNTIQPNSTGNSFYLHYGEAKGWRIILGEGDSAKVVKIRTNSEGVWGTDATHKRAILMIETDGVDTLTLPTSGNMKLIPDSVTVTTELLQSSKVGEEAFAIRIPIQDTLEGYFQIGSMIWGHVAFMAPQYQRGRSISYEPNIQSNITLDNMFHSRKMSDGARTFQIAWTEPIDTRNIMSRTPDYWQLSSSVGSQPVANYGDSPFQMIGIWDYLGNRFPAVYLPNIEKNVDNQIFNRAYEHALVRPEGAITIESVLGEEQENEMFRVATITLQEIE